MADQRKNMITIGTKSVQKPSAHTAILCSVPGAGNPLLIKALTLSSDKSHWPIPLRVIIDLQLRLGLRISEVLKITPRDLMPLGRVRIRSSKRGKDRIVNYQDSFGYLEKCNNLSIVPFMDYDRFFIYRAYKKEGIMMYHSKGKKYSVTHLFRHLLAVSLDGQVDDKSLISDFIGHKSLKSLDSYVK